MATKPINNVFSLNSRESLEFMKKINNNIKEENKKDVARGKELLKVFMHK